MPSDIVRIMCPSLKCRSVLSVPASARGKIVRCRECGTRVSVPSGQAIKPEAAAAPGDGADASATK
ncbi:MAG: hypothetical protein WD042_05640 [Phycisphaeraceae bacterium]